MRKFSSLSLVGAAVVALAAAPAAASVYGSLANFDTVNGTGHTAHGFEIEIEDSSYDHYGTISSIFGLDRNFGGLVTEVERYGAPTVEYITGFGARITYKATFANGAWDVGTLPTQVLGPFANPGDSCWPNANVGYPNVPCDHFGVATYGSPAKTTYSWLIETAPDSPILTKSVVGIPAVNFAPPAAGQRGQVVIRAVAEPVEPQHKFGEAYWVKTFKTKVALDHNVELHNLLRGEDDVEETEVEVEWKIFQNRLAGQPDEPGAQEEDVGEFDLGDNDKAVLWRYEFYEYKGPFDVDGEGEATCDVDQCETDPVGLGYVGDYVGGQIAGFNAVEAPLPAVPEPQSYALMLAGLVLVGLRALKQRS